MLLSLGSRRPFSRHSEREVLALAISSEEDDARIDATCADRLRKDYPATAAMFGDASGRRRLDGAVAPSASVPSECRAEAGAGTFESR